MKRYAALGAALGALAALVAFAPAAWLAGAVSQASGERLLLAESRGTVWQGSALVVLTGGPGSRDASALPGRLHWRLGLDGTALALRARQACCLNGELLLRVVPGLGRLRLELPANTAGAAGLAVGQWPASWLAGLGTPWNTLKPAGTLQLNSPGLWLEQVQGRWRFNGRAELLLGSMASRLSTLETLGSYRLLLVGNAAGGDAATLQLSTTSGALQLSGSGQFLGSGAASHLRFRGQAGAEPGSEAVLNNLLNIIGRRQGAVSVISIG
ncbi:MAG: type II secretion system protein N [Betaproteobacteria bacterium]|nr:type II secretion system protein N [Betaproteobacteria bacterium]